MEILVITLIVTNLLLVLLPAVLFWMVRVVAKWMGFKVRYAKFGFFSLALCLLWTLMALYGYGFGRFRYEVTSVDYADGRIPEAFDGYRIVHISDLHLGGFKDHEAFVDTIVNSINRLHPDLICFTGDLVSISHHEAIPFISTLRRLEARDGVISILGNHDYAVYDRQFQTQEEREKDRAQLITLERDSMDWRLLLNEPYCITHGEDSILIVGLENQACGLHQKVRRGDMGKAMPDSLHTFSILLSHDPSQWDAEVVGKTKIPLTLSGHTHAMQFRVFGWTPCRWFYDRSDGLYTLGQQSIYVNIGLGELMPFRIGATPEVTLLTLKRKY